MPAVVVVVVMYFVVDSVDISHDKIGADDAGVVQTVITLDEGNQPNARANWGKMTNDETHDDNGRMMRPN